MKKAMPKFFMYETLIVMGVLMAVLTLIKLIGLVEFSSDWFWFIAAVGLVIEGSISLAKQRMFEKKYKIILKD